MDSKFAREKENLCLTLIIIPHVLNYSVHMRQCYQLYLYVVDFQNLDFVKSTKSFQVYILILIKKIAENLPIIS